MRDRRHVPRYISDLKAELVPAERSLGAEVRLVTLSIRGSCIEGIRALKRGQKCELKLAWDTKTLQAQAEVVWLDGEGRAGLRFLSVDEPTHALLREVCSTLKLQPIQPPQPPPPAKRKTHYE